jgi:nitrous oxidase accessory protein
MDTCMRTAVLHSILTLALMLSLVAQGQSNIGDRYPVSVVMQMIDQAEAGETVRIPAGVYEGNLVVRKSVTLEGKDGAIFDGLGKGTVIEVLTENVTIRGCTIRSSGIDVTGEPSAIRVVAPRATIESNIIQDVLFGIDLRESPGSVIRDNMIVCKDLEPGRRGDGIRLWWSHGCVVDGNTVHSSRDMVFWYSENLQIVRNTVTDSRYGLHFMYSHDTVLEENDLRNNSVGVYLMYSNRITLRGNRMQNNRGASGYGIGLKDCDDISIDGNALLSNRVGVYLDNSPSSIGSTGLFISNMIAFNEVGLLATPNTHDNVFTQNAFIENESPAATHGRGQLVSNDFSNGDLGNYWSDYAGFDLDDDGIGDVSYEPISLFGAMLANEPNLRLFIHSPAQQAIEFTARALPELRPNPTLIDPLPLSTPPQVDLNLQETAGNSRLMGIFAAFLVSVAVACLLAFAGEQGLKLEKTGDSL